MIKNITIGVLAVALAVVSFLYFGSSQPVGIGQVTGQLHYQVEHFIQGFYVGTSRQFNVDNAGLLTTTGGVTNSGATTLTGTLTNTAATSTLGCLRVYQQGATTVASSTFYLMASSTATGGVNGSFEVFVTSTKPTYCT